MINDHRLLSSPVRLHWAGWETDTIRLQQAGWSLSAEQDLYRNEMRLALKHEGARVYGLTYRLPWYFMEELKHAPYGHSPPILPVRYMAARAEVLMHETGPLAFAPIDAIPQFVTTQRRSIEDFAHFAAPLARTEQIIVPEEDVPTLMDRILKMQDPSRIERIREEVRRSHAPGAMIEGQRRQKFHAQILSFAA